jgi:hypothetical protein
LRGIGGSVSPRVRSFWCVALAGAAVLTFVPMASAGFSVTSAASPSFSVMLNGNDQSGSYTIPLTVDNSAVGVSLTGWNLTVSTTQYTTGGGKTLSAAASTITGVTSACSGTCASTPTNSVAYPLAVPVGSTVKFFNAAAATGIGTFTVTPSVTVAVPANAYAGSYTSTLTIALATGP